jgi:hypothetical protein
MNEQDNKQFWNLITKQAILEFFSCFIHKLEKKKKIEKIFGINKLIVILRLIWGRQEQKYSPRSRTDWLR